MHVGWKSARAFIALVVLCVFGTAGQASVALAQGSTNGAAGQMPAFYEGQLVTVNMKEMPDNAAGSLIGKNPSVNTISCFERFGRGAGVHAGDRCHPG